MVYFVCAGCGSVEYLTVKAYMVLCKAQIIIYSPFVDSSVLRLCKGELINARHFSLSDVIKIIEENLNKTVVYLVNGDFSFFCNRQEYVDYLKSANIPYEIIPGITAISACAATIGQECLLQNISDCAVITYYDGRFTVPYKQTLKDIAELNGTIVLYMMSDSLLSSLRQELLDGGMSKDTPVIAVRMALRKDEQVLRTTIDEMETLYGKGLDYMTLYLIGQVFSDKQKRDEIIKNNFAAGVQRPLYFQGNWDYKKQRG